MREFLRIVHKRSLQYKTPFDVIAKAPKNGNLNTMLGGLESDQD